jgi:predicted transcriptional regulator
MDREMSDLVQFAAEVRAGRAVLGWSQTELARRTSVTQRAIYCIEQNIVQPRKQTEERIIGSFTDAGLRFERLSSGGFKLTVPNKAIVRLHSGSRRAK